MDSCSFTFAQPEWLGEAASTNTVLKNRIASGAPVPSGYVTAARIQMQGRGRMGSEWLSSQEGDLTFSFCWQADPDQARNPAVLGTLPMACALGVRDFLAAPPRSIACSCKWPNDVLAGDAKICGILTEGGFAPSGAFGLVVGIGVNVRAVPGRDARFGRSTAAVETLAGPQPGPEELLPELLGYLEGRIESWRIGGFAAVREDLTASLWGLGKRIAAKTSRGRAEGIVEGLDDSGGLLLRSGGGTVSAVSSVTAIESGW